MKIMRIRVFLGVLMLLSILYISPTVGEQYNPSISVDVITVVTVINGDAELDAATLVGDGSSGNPFILEFDISGIGISDLVTIIGTEDHFIIQNSFLHGGNWGIVFNDVENGVIYNTDVYENVAGGIQFIASDYNLIDDNDIYENVEVGISFINSSLNIVEDNEIYDHDPDAETLLDLSQHTGGSGVIFDPSNDNLFYSNVIYNNAQYGIHGLKSNNATIEENTIYGNNIGVRFDFMTNSNVSSNNIYDHNEFGIYIENSDNIVILNNTFSDNTDGNLFVNNGNSSITELDTDIATTIFDDSIPYPEITLIITLVLIPIGKKLKRRR